MQILDFDGTIILENSSRMLELETMKKLPNSLQNLIYPIFFGKMKVFFNKVWGFISIVFFSNRDFRLFIFLVITRKYFLNSKIDIYKTVSEKITFRPDILKTINNDTIILSNGISDLIKYILHSHGISVKVIASNIDKFKISSLNNFSYKFSVLNSFKNFYYITDDILEAKYICKRYKWKIRFTQKDSLYYINKFH
jgi:hypothetical protein